MGWELKAFGLARNLLITATLTLAGSTAAIHLDAMTPRIRAGQKSILLLLET